MNYIFHLKMVMPCFISHALFFFLLQLVQRDMEIYRSAGKRGQSEPQNEQVYDNALIFYIMLFALVLHTRTPLSVEMPYIVMVMRCCTILFPALMLTGNDPGYFQSSKAYMQSFLM